MKVTVKQGNIEASNADATILFSYEDVLIPTRYMAAFDEVSRNLLRQMIDAGDIKGKAKEVQLVFLPDTRRVRRLIFVGLGKKSEANPEKIREAFALAARKVREMKWHSMDIAPSMMGLDFPTEWIISVAVESMRLGLYRFTHFKTEEGENIRHTVELTAWIEKEEDLKKAVQAAREAERLGDAVIFVRDLVSMPSNEMTPKAMAREALKIGEKRQSIKVNVLDEKEIKKTGMHALLGVAKGSREEGQFIIMDYQGSESKGAPIVLVGKGLTFDSGGISIKPAENMEGMKTDMAGGAAVMGVVMAAADLKLPLRIIGLIPATENMPGGLAYKPGDVLKTLSGLTVEVISTDAEGRLILADSLTYAKRYKPAAVIDLATLTGACIIALGENVMGMMGTARELKEKLMHASELTGEKIWELPLWEDSYEAIKSDIADLKNVGGRPGGAMTAGAFLSKFITGYPWVHLDIAGPSWLNKDHPYTPKGASGVGVRLLVQMLKNWSAIGDE
ncbi:MAG: leucyl aminopeptidase [Syntrophales bacterium]|jgi:leucyl aminopeptidase|nr:leucyl aminopeptidase [Syntrophales bacterium]